jgi:hypothetical protein
LDAGAATRNPWALDGSIPVPEAITCGCEENCENCDSEAIRLDVISVGHPVDPVIALSKIGEPITALPLERRGPFDTFMCDGGPPNILKGLADRLSEDPLPPGTSNDG